ncbi:hypothetical protein [Alkalimarinus coralli]|uniref:hypothetical protein n=1 Tax=Alkalimarinus coralli TaxID=2935863 RepID=UPI00308440AE
MILPRKKGGALDVGFYYMANSMGRLIGTVLSGLASSLFLLATMVISTALPAHGNANISPH